MEFWFFLVEFVMLLGGAFLLGAAAQRLGQSPIIGYLLTGTLLGPFLFNTGAVTQVAELGVALLLFSIGLEFSFRQLRRLGKMALGGGSIQVLATLGIAALIIHRWIPMSQALAIGAVVALSSTAMVLRLLVDRSEMDSIRGRACLSILLLQDIAIVPLVLMVSFLSPAAAAENVPLRVLKLLAAAGGLLILFYLLLYVLIPRLLSRKILYANRELTVLLATSVGLGSAWAAHTVHISPALGAFIAGMLLGESPFAAQIRADIGALRTIMVTLFFTSIGMLANPLWFFRHVHWVLAAAVLVILFKTGIIYVVTRMFGLPGRHALATGISLSQVGEFSFVLLAASREGGILSATQFDLLISVIILLMFATPYLVQQAVPLANAAHRRISGLRPAGESSPDSRDQEASRSVLIAGLGPAGRHVVEALQPLGFQIVAVDVNPGNREYADSRGIRLHLGDAGQADVLEHAGIRSACMAVITVPDPGTAVAIIQTIRRLQPDISIAARCRYQVRMGDLETAGADMVVNEELNVGEALSRQILAAMSDEQGMRIACRLTAQWQHEPEYRVNIVEENA